MYPQAPGLSLEYSHKGGLQTVITEKLLQIGPVTRFSVWGLLQWAKSHVGLKAEWGCGTGRRRRRPSSRSTEGKGWTSPILLLPLAHRERQRLKRRVASSPSPQHKSHGITRENAHACVWDKPYSFSHYFISSNMRMSVAIYVGLYHLKLAMWD
jgi:hypothetical protein